MQFKAKGVDTIAVTGVNDIFVMDAWKKASGADKIEFLADGNGEFAKAIDLTLDWPGNGMGTRSKRYSMLIDDGVVKKLNVEDAGQVRSLRRRRPAEAALIAYRTHLRPLMAAPPAISSWPSTTADARQVPADGGRRHHATSGARPGELLHLLLMRDGGLRAVGLGEESSVSSSSSRTGVSAWSM